MLLSCPKHRLRVAKRLWPCVTTFAMSKQQDLLNRFKQVRTEQNSSEKELEWINLSMEDLQERTIRFGQTPSLGCLAPSCWSGIGSSQQIVSRAQLEYQGRVGVVRFRRGDADFCVVVAYIPVEPHTQAQKQYNINIWQWIQHLLDQLPSIIDVFAHCFWMPTVVSVQSLVHVWGRLNHKNKTTMVRCCTRVFNITTFLLLTHGIPAVLRTLGSLVTVVASTMCVSLNPNNLVCKSVKYFIQQVIGYKVYLPQESATIVHYLFGFVIVWRKKAQVFQYLGILTSWCQVHCKELIEMIFCVVWNMRRLVKVGPLARRPARAHESTQPNCVGRGRCLVQT